MKSLLGDTSVVGAFEVCVLAFGAIIGTLITAIPAIVLAIAEQPFRNASVVGAARAALPSVCAVSLATQVGGLVRVVTTVIVKVTHPQLLDASSVPARELRLRVTFPVI